MSSHTLLLIFFISFNYYAQIIHTIYILSLSEKISNWILAKIYISANDSYLITIFHFMSLLFYMNKIAWLSQEFFWTLLFWVSKQQRTFSFLYTVILKVIMSIMNILIQWNSESAVLNTRKSIVLFLYILKKQITQKHTKYNAHLAIKLTKEYENIKWKSNEWHLITFV